MPNAKVIAVTAVIAIIAVAVANNVTFLRRFVTPAAPLV